MPYILPEDRERYEHSLQDLFAELRPNEPGDLNYVLTRLILEWLDTTGVSYRSLNTAIGVLECAKQELYRRTVAPYEDTKIDENGDL